tara:strand:+ start:564 stop:1499 length:936 start_codon:yes stop_codon:yes gene_type:complete
MLPFDPQTDYAEYLASEARTPNSILHEFVLLFDPNDGSIHIFFEGKDDFLFYPSFLRATIDYESAHIHNCKGKPVVREVKDYISRNGYPPNRFMFFVDRDFDDYLGCQMISDASTYITDGYAIENDLAHLDCAKILLSDVVGMRRTDPEYSMIIDTLAKSAEEFAKAIKPIMAWCIAMRAKGAILNLNNAKLNQMFDVFSDGVVKRKPNGFNNFVTATKACDVEVTVEELKRSLDLINSDEPKYWVRGKYALWHFELALAKVLGEINSQRKASALAPLPIPSALREHKLFELMGGRIQAPASLTRFLAGYA